MKWQSDDMDQYFHSKEYIDTVIIPIYTLPLDQINQEYMKKSKHLEEIALYIESQLRGRVILLPTLYHYVSSLSADMESKAQGIIKSVEDLYTNNTSFKHVLIIVENQLLSQILNEKGYCVFQNFQLTNVEDYNDIVEIGNKGYQFLLNIWKGKGEEDA